ncbi:peroxiredoxin family protein [Chitinophaga pendula]|uniref:redoxin domain-containing protein n=1 Tax=Chitinophaga TaxID=79328 RepID=UPI000BB0A1DB|nr:MULTISPECIES: redoxin domain-containing protein [Chitinophaga]ASZ12377.1 hypothetical protein CK934_16135 [Chitinophaga sp. MD30]UCJ10025.1 peroxiredoxin family protein [Chitinophaga pendula]
MPAINRFADYLTYQLPEQFARPVAYKSKISPAQNGTTLPPIFLHNNNSIVTAPALKDLSGPTSICRLLDKPLVLAFHSIHWNEYGTRLLLDLQDIQEDIRIMGGRLLVLSTEDKAQLQDLLDAHAFSFGIVQDKDHAIAKKVGIFDEADPVWNRVSGIDAHVPIPAIYVISPTQEIVYSFVDHYFEQHFSTRDLLSAVYDHRAATPVAGVLLEDIKHTA